ncbi:MAG: M23 family metallopeptidase [Candidatus Tectomicrobia bacterium]|nr:M23 family metallopeptidase [Candidatus Tectomicrobia bacterium]
MRGARRTGWVVWALLFLVGGCSAGGLFRRPGIYHTIRPGETLWRISQTYGVDLEEVVKANHIGDPRRIVAGTKIFIPGASRVLEVPPRLHGAAVGKAPPWPGRETRVPTGPLPRGPSARVTLPAEVDFIWPIKGRVTSFFGRRGRAMHQGVDIAAPTGTQIRAAEEGMAIFSDRGPGGYGLMVILRHPNGFHTIYAHNHRNLVRKGQRVRQGDVIALVGSTGRSTGPHLHFEIRNRAQAKDPLFYLP